MSNEVGKFGISQGQKIILGLRAQFNYLPRVFVPPRNAVRIKTLITYREVWDIAGVKRLS